ncbi:hypothetical protein DRN72_04840 [Methanosarcinales archaeon]|nr:MAG: hypothetical protein DRN72_04840 [Methanosarcinales archaeon]
MTSSVKYEVRTISQREFAFFYKKGEKWNEKKQRTDPIYYIERRKSFTTNEELWDYIEKKNPTHCFFSTAYYTFPHLAPSERSFWNGTDLFFDFDSKQNLKLAYAEARFVYDYLQDYFAIDDLEMIFSGSKGYHVIAYGYHNNPRLTEKLRKLSTQERREIVDYFALRYAPEEERKEYDKRNFTPLLTLDPEPTIDIHRIRRLPGTVHGGSGEMCKVIRSTF